MVTGIQAVVCGETFTLLPSRAVYWHGRATLLIADPHFGKAAAFRAAAIPVPGGTTADALSRLDDALVATRAERLVILGDLLHSTAGLQPATMAQLREWRTAHYGLEIVLVRGNHDAQAGDPPLDWDIQCVDEPLADRPFALRHFPPDDEPLANGLYAIAGHVHPAVTLRGAGFSERLACFYFGKRHGLLPAFGDFTGTGSVRPVRGDQIYLIAGDVIIPRMV